jgi:succinyl-diaminopimelate desuccinylase
LTLLKLKPLDEGNAHFPPSNLEITSIDTGNMADNVIPAVARAQFNIRFNDEHTSESLRNWIEEQVAAALLDTGIGYSIEYSPVCDSFLTAPGAWVKKLGTAVFEETRREPALSTSGGTSDARFIKALCPVVEIGPLNATAHKVDECTSIADLESLTRIFTRFLHLALA